LVFNSSVGILTVGNGLVVGTGGTFLNVKSNGLVGIGTTNPTQKLDINGDLRLTGTIYDYYNQPGVSGQLLLKNSFGGLQWTSQGAVRSGAGGTITNIQYHNAAGLVDGASNFVFDPSTSRIGIGSTQPAYLFDVLGYSRFKGQTEIDNLRVTGVATVGFATITNSYLGVSTIGYANITNSNLGITTVGLITATNAYIGVATVGFATITNSYLGVTTVGFASIRNSIVGVLTVTEVNIDRTNLINLNVTGIATIATLGVTGLTTTRNLNVIGFTTTNGLNVTEVATTKNLNATGIATINNLNVTGVGTFGSIKLDGNIISTNSGNLILDSLAGTTQINDAVYVNDTTESNDKNTGSIITEGGVGIEKNLNVGGNLNVAGTATLASSGGITTTGGDLYVAGDLYVKDDVFYDELNSRKGTFTESLTTRDFNTTGIATISTLGVTGATTLNSTLNVSGVTTVSNSLNVSGTLTLNNSDFYITNTTGVGGDIYANGGTDASFVIYNTTNSGTINLTAKNSSGTYNSVLTASNSLVLINGNLLVSGISTFNGNVTLGDATTDRVNFVSSVGTGITPSTSGTYDLGSSINKWNNVYANNFVGAITGNADTATKLQTSRNIAITGDLAWNVNFDGSANVTGVGTLANSGVAANTYGSSTTVPVFAVDAKGRVTSVTNTNINFSNATNADKVGTISTATNATFYPTFVDSNNATASYESLYTDAGISYNPSTDLLFLTNVIVSGISTFNGNVIFGDATTDTVSFTSRVDTAITPSTNATSSTDVNGKDLGSISNNWRKIYAIEYSGRFIGNADTATYAASAGIATYAINAGISTNIKGGTIGNIPYQSSPNTTLFLANGTAGYILKSNGVGFAPSWVDVTTGFNVASADYAINAGIATNLKGGIAFQIPYQTAPSTTAFLPNGTPGYILKSNGTSSAPSWIDVTAGFNVASADYATNAGISTNIKGGLIGNIPYQSSPNNTTFLTNGASGTILKSNGVGSAPSWVDVTTGFNVASADYATNAGISTNIKGGIAFQIPYQTAPSTTAFLPNGTAGYILKSNGTSSAPSWVDVTAGFNVASADYAINAGIATNLKGGLIGNIPYQSSPNNTTFLTNGASGTILKSNGVGFAPSWVDVTTGFTVAIADYATNAGISTNIKGGAIGNIPYQSGANATTFLTNGASGTILKSNGVGFAPSWVDVNTGFTVAQADTIKTISNATNATFYPTFVDSNNVSADYESLYTDSAISYNPSIDLLTVSKIKPATIQDSGGGTGTANYVLTANGSGGWSWASVTGGGSPAIGGITVQEEGVTVGTSLGTQILNFIGGSVTATSPTTGTANITVTAASNVTVTQTGYGCANPITVAGGSAINIASNSNAYGTKFVQSTAPASACDGDVWYDTSGTDSGEFSSGTTLLFYQASAPTGWTKVTTHDNKALRVVSGAGGGSGGSTAFTSVFTSRGVPLLQHSHGVSDPGHAHNIYTGRNDNPNYHERGNQRGHIGNGWTQYDNLGGWVIGSGTGISVANAGTAGASMDFAVQYIDVIIASKN
jgi:hypothetical protein